MINKLNLPFGLKAPDEYNKYFDFPAVFSLILIMPLTIVAVSAALKIFGFPYSFEFVSKMGKPPYYFIPIYFCSLASLMICFIGILVVNAKKESKEDDVNFSARKSFFNLAIMLVDLAYTGFIFLFVEFDRFGNIPVGKN